MKKLVSLGISFPLAFFALEVTARSLNSRMQVARTETRIQDPSPVSDAVARKTTNARQTSDSGGVPATDESAEAKKAYDAAVALYEAGQLDEAIDAFKQATKLRPNDAQTHYALGLAYTQSKSYKDAADSFKRAVRLQPNWPEAHFKLGVMSYVLGKKGQANDEYRKLRDLNSPLANTLYKIIKEDGATGTSDIPDRAPARKSSEIVPVSGVNSTPTNRTESPTTQPATTSTDTKPVGESMAARSTPVSSKPDDEQVLTTLYRIGVGDVLDIRLLNSLNTRSTLYTVIDGGIVDLPLAGGPIPVAGLTAEEVQSRITAELKRRAVGDNGLVSVSVRQYGSHTVIVTGLVGNPGTKILRREAVPLYVLLAEAQPRLDAGRVSIMRRNASTRVLDLNDAAALNFIVRPGDVLNVSARPQEFYYIAGRINYPGQKNFQPGITLLQAILAAGGTTRQNDDTIELSREGIDGRLATTKFNLKDIKAGKTQDPRLQPGDRIEVIK